MATKTNTNSTRQINTSENNDYFKRHEYLHKAIPDPPKSPYTVVNRSALNFTATERLLELSRPKIKKDHLIREGLVVDSALFKIQKNSFFFF